MNEIQEYKKSNWLTNEEKSVIDRQFFPQGATVDDKRYCMQVAEAFGLNPILKQIHFIPRKVNIGTPQNPKWVEKTEPFTGRDSFLLIAHRTGLFDGMETTSNIEEIPYLDNGEWKLKRDLTATTKVYKKDCKLPFIVTVNYSEYVQKKKDGTNTQIWNDMPITMLKKVSESQALKKAFNITISSVDEVNNSEIIEAKISEDTPQQKPKSLNDLAKIDYSVEVLNRMIKNNVSEAKAKEYLSNKSDEEIKQLFDDEDLFQNECMDLIL